ncbi:restriction endonuclease subunit S [Methanobrevibacter smithii]|uniref:restriction endonuclease subunit S n=1 Tax=Methanobrevibacter smithii TaxID=2173 RepID=UPI0037DC04DB
MKVSLDQIAQISIGASLSRYSKKYDGEKQKTDVLYCTLDEFYIKEGDIAGDIDSKYLTQKGDVIFKLSEPQAAISIDESGDIPENVVVSSKFVILKPNGVDPIFLAELLNSNTARHQIQKFTEGVIKQIKKADVEKLKFEIPSIEEQKEYVETIKLINKEIILQKKLITENMNLKEAIIQKTQGGE